MLSPSTTSVDRFRKLDEYKSHPALQLILLADSRVPAVAVWRRSGVGWAIEDYSGLEASIALPEIGATLRLADLYDGLEFPAA